MLNWRSTLSGPIVPDGAYVSTPYETPTKPHHGLWVTNAAHENYKRAIGHADPVPSNRAPPPPAPPLDHNNIGGAPAPPLPTMRVKPEGMENYEQTLGKGVVNLLAIQGKEWTPSIPKPGEKNHQAANVRRMRKIQRDSRERARKATEPLKALWKSPAYVDAPSRLVELMQDVNPKQPINSTYLRAHSRQGTRVGKEREMSTETMDLAIEGTKLEKTLEKHESKQKQGEANKENEKGNKPTQNSDQEKTNKNIVEKQKESQDGVKKSESVYNLLSDNDSNSHHEPVLSEAVDSQSHPGEKVVAVTPRMRLTLKDSSLKLDLRRLEEDDAAKLTKGSKLASKAVNSGRRPRTPSIPSRPPNAPRPQSARAASSTSLADGVAAPAASARVSSAGRRPCSARLDRDPKDFLIRRETNFVRVNSKGAKETTIRKCPSVSNLENLKKKSDESWESYKKKQWGRVPKYLVDRKEAWRKEEEEERKRNERDPDCPPGHVPMSKEEQAATLDQLRRHRQELLRQLGAVPIRADTLRVKKVRLRIEEQLEELDEAVKTFSKPKVFVKAEEGEEAKKAEAIQW